MPHASCWGGVVVIRRHRHASCWGGVIVIPRHRHASHRGRGSCHPSSSPRLPSGRGGCHPSSSPRLPLGKGGCGRERVILSFHHCLAVIALAILAITTSLRPKVANYFQFESAATDRPTDRPTDRKRNFCAFLSTSRPQFRSAR